MPAIVRGGSSRNVPVPSGFSDNELAFLVEHVRAPLGRDFAPDALVIQCGADALADDPMSGVDLSNQALWEGDHDAFEPGPAAARARRGRLQSVNHRPLLGGNVGDSEWECLG